MNTIAFGDEIVAEEAVVTADAQVSSGTKASDNDGIGLDAQGNPTTKITFDKNKADGKKSNLAKITDTTNPVSWNNFYAADLIATVLEGSEGNDTYLNNKEKLNVSTNNNANPDAADPKDRVENLEKDAWYDYTYRVFDLKKNNTNGDAYLLVGYYFNDGEKAYVKGSDAFADTKDEYKTLGLADDVTEAKKRILTTPVTTWDGRSIALDKKDENTKKTRQNLVVKASIVQYKDGTVTELAGTSVKKVKFSKKSKNKASVTYATHDANVAVKYDGKDEDKLPIPEHDVIGSALPTFTITLGLSKDAKKFKKAVKNVLKDKKFEFGIVQKAVTVTDPTGNNFAPYLNDLVKTAAYEIKDASSNDADKIMAEINKQFEKNAVYTEYAKALQTNRDGDFYGGLGLSKFKKTSPVLFNEVILTKKGNVANGTAKVNLKKKDFSVKSGKMAGETVYYVDFPENGNVTYAKTFDAENGTFGNDLSAFGFKWAFRKTKDKEWRWGIYKDDNFGFVYNAK